MGFFLVDNPPAKGGQVGGKQRTSTRIADASPKRAVKEMPLRVLAATQYSAGCRACSLDAIEHTLNHPKMDPTGASDPLLYIIGEAPGENEDKTGVQFIGKSGELIRNLLPRYLERRTRWSNAVQCRPPANRAPTTQEIACCSHRLDADIQRTKPVVVMGFGSVPLRWALNAGGTDDLISDWRGQLIPIRVGSYCCWYAPIWHPSYVLRTKHRKEGDGAAYFETYQRDVRRIFDLLSQDEIALKEPWVPQGEELDAGLHWELSWKVDAVAERLDLLSGSLYPDDLTVDIETNALRPYAEGAKILSIGFGTWEHSYAVPIQHRESKWTPKQLKQVWELVGAFLRKGKRYWAHSLKFETEWLSMPWALGRNILFEVDWQDTMAQAAVLSTSTLVFLSLDSRCKALFGVGEKHLDDLDRSRLDQLPLPKVLRYNARDCKFEDLVRQFQTPLVAAEGLERAYELMVNRVPALTIAQQEGMLPNFKFTEAKNVELKQVVADIDKKISQLPVVRKFEVAAGKPFKSSSNPQLVSVFRDHLKRPEGRHVDGGVEKYSVDEKVLSQIEHPLAQLILERRSIEKLNGTYIIGLCRPDPTDKKRGKLLWPDGLIHTVYNYLVTRTGRLSSEDPNLQNFPKREHKEIRDAIMAAFGCLLAALDYGQIEARVIAMASLCPVLTKALWEHYDIHMAWAETISKAFPFVLQKYEEQAKREGAKEIKLFRTDVKNVWTFPMFFGSQLAPIARTLGIEERKLKPYYLDFWEQFAAVKKWQEKVLRRYSEKGYCETLTGRRRYEPLTPNQVINSPIQGTASDIVVDAQRRCAEEAYETQRWELAARMNVHDDLTFSLPEDVLEESLARIVEIMCTPEFDFVTVPITVEISLGKSWGSMKELATVESTDYGYPKKRH